MRRVLTTHSECVGLLTQNRPYSPRYSDIWSLGVVMLNLITDCLPWAKPSCEDHAFGHFLEEPDYFRDNFAISEEVDDVLQQIFRLNPTLRITLPDLRSAVLDIERFYDDSHDPYGERECSEESGPTRPGPFLQGQVERDGDIANYSITPTATVRPPSEPYAAPDPVNLPTPRFADRESFVSEADDVIIYPRAPNPIGKVCGVCNKCDKVPSECLYASGASECSDTSSF